ncbi:Spy/CpxP family protein refolding chaperone [Carboxylicivirga linearis]|uniref:Periplasmic heavy metal sensor n=1 Tax=Carboxylicivirga linearis TaxID=1628157 RepID=A0ABS5JYV7_9BACT|nr:Spy/CpxP family protein refolding chaperone [Carboxylicivirga linearis]MBS2100073.1 hypothetical protein [Carboxylicivirga linearis]
MKTKLFLGLIALAMVAVSATAQQQRKQAFNRQDCVLKDDLTQEQKDKMDELRVAFYQKTKADHNQLNELITRKHTLETTDPVDKDALFECLASINTIQTNLQKERIRHFQDVKANLTDDQVILFDARKKGPKGQMGQGYGLGKGNQGQCPGCDRNSFGRGNGQRGNGQGYGKSQGQGRGQRNQAGQGRGTGQRRNLTALDLTDAQKEFMDQSRLQLLKKEQTLKNKLNELNAQLKTQTTGKNINLKQVDKTITEQSEIKLQLAKLRAEHKMEVRNQMTDEQKMAFDSRGFGRKGRHGRR